MSAACSQSLGPLQCSIHGPTTTSTTTTSTAVEHRHAGASSLPRPLLHHSPPPSPLTPRPTSAAANGDRQDATFLTTACVSGRTRRWVRLPSYKGEVGRARPDPSSPARVESSDLGAWGGLRAPMGPPSLLLPLFLLLLQAGANRLPDLDAMAALRRELSVADWNHRPEQNYCLWRGVGCDAASAGTVVSLELPHWGLRGNLSAVAGLKSLKRLDLSGNSFGGAVPSSLGGLLQLEFLDLSMNRLFGSIPAALGGLASLRSLNLSNNLLSGEIPTELRGLQRLRELQISANDLGGRIPTWVAGLADLEVLSAYENRLAGAIPPELGSNSQLRVLNLHSNRLEGPIPKSLFSSGRLEVLVLTMNRLSGSLPESVGNCMALSSLRVGNNRLTGNIPASIGNASSLTYFEADNNQFSGGIPPEFSRCSNLTLLNLSGNRLSGTFPPELGILRNLQELIVSGNELVGCIPLNLLKCRNLSKLDLSSNRFNGSLPEDLCSSMARLQFLILGDNLVSGAIPSGIAGCTRLLELHLGGNCLFGGIPHELGSVKSLQIALNLSSNRLSGLLPQELGKLDKLVTLDVSSNRLSGRIPSELAGMQSLIDVNFSNNQFAGPIPSFTPFQKSQASSFTGNRGLCGDPLDIPCKDYHRIGGEAEDHKVSVKVILSVIGSGLIVFISVAIVVALFMQKERQELGAKSTIDEGGVNFTAPTIIIGNVFVENMKQAIDLNSVVEATMKDSNKYSIGTFSVVYKAVMPSGLVLSVKRLKSVDKTVVHHRGRMVRELERLASLCHKNLMRPIGFVMYEDIALLIHPYSPNGTLAQLLHDEPQSGFRPDWPRRLSIAIGIAEGLAFLHHVAILHLDISSGNVFLDAHYNALVGEIEISKLIEPSKGVASISAVAGSFGYIPPEYAYTMQVTAPGNIYSYGVVLLEMLTSRWPIDEAFGEGTDLVKWVHGASRRGETPEQVMDARLSTVSFAWRKQMLEVLKIAMLCTDATPAKRPKAKKVIEMLLEASRL